VSNKSRTPAAGYDRVEYKYNRQGEVVELKDQNGTVHQYEYDKIGRRKLDRATTLGTGIDDDVLRLEWAYEDRGMLQKVTSYDATSAGNVVNQVELAYNGFGQLTDDKQSHGGLVQTGTPKVQYSYADGSAGLLLNS
jgi:YD repeat-containing protein